MKRHIAVWLPLCVGCILGSMAAGCGSPTYKPSANEAAQFKGGPMPESARRVLQQSQRAPKPVPAHP